MKCECIQLRFELAAARAEIARMRNYSTLIYRGQPHQGAQAVADASGKTIRTVYRHLAKFGHLDWLDMTPTEIRRRKAMLGET